MSDLTAFRPWPDKAIIIPWIPAECFWSQVLTRYPMAPGSLLNTVWQKKRAIQKLCVVPCSPVAWHATRWGTWMVSAWPMGQAVIPEQSHGCVCASQGAFQAHKIQRQPRNKVRSMRSAGETRWGPMVWWDDTSQPYQLVSRQRSDRAGALILWSSAPCRQTVESLSFTGVYFQTRFHICLP